jgi:hypothetical protein
MATPDGSLISTPVQFDSDMFKNAIRFAMQMGTPPDPDNAPLFIFDSTAPTYWRNGSQLMTSPRLDRDGKPIDPSVEVRETPGTEVSVDCSVSLHQTRYIQDELPVGFLGGTVASVTVLGEQYALIAGCKHMIFNGDTYVFSHENNSGLFDVAVHNMIFYSKDEN